jgi:hypothetical protein
MTDGYDCYKNPLAERVNGILKGEFLLQSSRDMVREAVDIYNVEQPHHALKGVVSQISQQVMTSPAPGDRYTRGFLTGRPRVFIDGRPGLPSLQSMTVS